MAGLVQAIQTLRAQVAGETQVNQTLQAQVAGHTQVNQTLQAQVNSLRAHVKKSFEARVLTLSEQRPALLPVDSLVRLHLQQQLGGGTFLREFRLSVQPETLKEFVDYFKKDDDTYDLNQAIWICDGAFVRVGSLRPGGNEIPGEYNEVRYLLSLDDCHLMIHSKTLDKAMSCLDFLFGLSDSHFETLVIRDLDAIQYGRTLCCPLTNPLLEKHILQNTKRENQFSYMVFTPDQSRILATTGTRTNIGFASCKFDEEAAFAQACAERQDEELGPKNLSFRWSLPFDEENLVASMDRLKLESLELCGIELSTEECCRAVSTAELQHLELDACGLRGDGGAALVESVREGRGPKELCLRGGIDLFDATETFRAFLHALGGNTHLERLDLEGFEFHDDVGQAFATGLGENGGLMHLGVSNMDDLDERFFDELMGAVAKHPLLRTLVFEGIGSERHPQRAALSEAVSEMLSRNKQVEEISFDEYAFDPVVWEKLVAPKLECNVYRKRFDAILKISDDSVRAQVVVRALACVKSKPSLVNMLLTSNRDIISSYIGRA
jgi:hypothetical protein